MLLACPTSLSPLSLFPSSSRVRACLCASLVSSMAAERKKAFQRADVAVCWQISQSPLAKGALQLMNDQCALLTLSFGERRNEKTEDQDFFECAGRSMAPSRLARQNKGREAGRRSKAKGRAAAEKRRPRFFHKEFFDSSKRRAWLFFFHKTIIFRKIPKA